MDLLDLEHFLPYRLSVLANRVSRGFGRLYEQRFDLKLPEWRVMAVLGRQPGITARDVAELTAMDKVAISRAVARMIEMGRVSAEAENALVAGIEASDLAVLDKLLVHLTEAAAGIDHD